MAKILIVDDEEDIAEVIRITLETSGHIVQTASNGAEGLTFVKKIEPDLVILDVMMPKMNGMQVVEILKGSDATAHIPILMLTAVTKNSLQPDEHWRKKVGVEDFMSKPFEPLELRDRVDKMLKERYREKGDGFTRYRIG
ncbi:MAG TPA: response regulator [bacterium]|nr:response regulator [bacterium]